jgi:hypothetical protein
VIVKPPVRKNQAIGLAIKNSWRCELRFFPSGGVERAEVSAAAQGKANDA